MTIRKYGNNDIGGMIAVWNEIVETSDGEHSIKLCHDPMMTFNHCMRAFMIHGHIHGALRIRMQP